MLNENKGLPENREKIKEIKSQIYSLASYNSNKIMLQNIDINDNLNRFRCVTKIVKRWAKNHFIYNGQFGFFNGATLNVLVIKLVLLYFDSSIIYLLEKFFQTYSEWDWDYQVKLEELSQKTMSWTVDDEIKAKNGFLLKYVARSAEEKIYLQRHFDILMVVLMPGYPEQNCAFNVNYSTKQIIQREFNEANNLIMNAKNMNGGYEEFINFWKNWLDGTKFLKKYNHFLLILCFVSKNDLKEAENYCRFVESRIRLELIFSIELNQRKIKYTHSTDKEKCLPNEIKRKFGGYYIQHWWVELKQTIK
uniref:polynucleotide adenylyltransferase n=2 Tax=Meloidogyne enterolobii TaxID=390850 RepID=A0A6V7WSE5_MELEN|nr:unnamed protein product [Meloidogyne enterolobii]